MAILETTIGLTLRGYTCLELRPVLPVTPETVYTYNVRLWVHDRLVYDRIQSVRHLQMRHYHVEMIAHALCNPRAYLGTRIQFSADPELVPQADSFPYSVAAVHLETDWLTMVIYATENKRVGEAVAANIYLRNSEMTYGDIEKTSQGKWGRFEELVWAMVICRPDDSIAFGQQLRAEIREAERQRVELRIPESDD